LVQQHYGIANFEEKKFQRLIVSNFNSLEKWNQRKDFIVQY